MFRYVFKKKPIIRRPQNKNSVFEHAFVFCVVQTIHVFNISVCLVFVTERQHHFSVFEKLTTLKLKILIKYPKIWHIYMPFSGI